MAFTKELLERMERDEAIRAKRRWMKLQREEMRKMREDADLQSRMGRPK